MIITTVTGSEYRLMKRTTAPTGPSKTELTHQISVRRVNVPARLIAMKNDRFIFATPDNRHIG